MALPFFQNVLQGRPDVRDQGVLQRWQLLRLHPDSGNQHELHLYRHGQARSQTVGLHLHQGLRGPEHRLVRHVLLIPDQ